MRNLDQKIVQNLYDAAWALLDALDMPANTEDEMREKFDRIWFTRNQLRQILSALETLDRAFTLLEKFLVYRGPPL